MIVLADEKEFDVEGELHRPQSPSTASSALDDRVFGQLHPSGYRLEIEYPGVWR